MRRSILFRVLIVAAVGASLMAAPAPASGQLTAGSVGGTIRDQSGAVVPGVQVLLRNNATAATYETTSNEQGAFFVPVVPVGEYTFHAELPGFKAATGSLVVRLNARSNLAILLEVGQTEDTVEVRGAPAVVDTSTAQVGETFSGRQIVELPVPQSNPNFLALLTPHTVDINTTGLTRGQLLDRRSSPVGGAVGAVGGNRARNNNFTVDGVDNNDPISTGPQGSVIQDAVQEFSVLKNSFNAEFGQSTGGQFNIVTKSGTNVLAGSGFWYHQNRALNATDILTRKAIDARTLTGKPRYDFNRAGGTLGGPIARDRLFFFGAYEYEKVAGAGTSTRFVFPTQQGYDLLAAMGPGVTRQGTTARVSPFVLDFLRTRGLVAPQADVPAITFPLVLGQRIPVGSLSQNIASFTRNDRVLANVDWNPGTRDRLHVRFNFDRGPNGVTPGVPKAELNANREITNQLLALTHVHTFSARLLNELRVSFHRQVTDNRLVDQGARNIPNIQVAEIPLSIGPSLGVPSGSRNNIYQIFDSLTWQGGRHLWKFGVDLRSNRVTDVGFVAPRGNYRWVNLEELLIDVPPTQVGQRGLGGPARVLDNHSINGFVQDEFTWTERVTLNFGLRYEFNSLPRDLAVQERQAIANVPGVIEFRRPTVEKDNWAPRVGFAWDVFGDGRTAVRAGYGLSYNTIFGAFVGGGQLPAALQQVFFTTCLPNCPIPVPGTRFLEGGGIPDMLVPFDTPERTRAATASYVPDQERPRTHTFMAAIEREIVAGLTGTVRYIRTEGRKLSVQAQLNAGIVPDRSAFLPTWFAATEVPALSARDQMRTLNQFLALVTRPYDQYGFAGSTLTTHLPIGESRYDGVAFELNRPFAAGLHFNANYTWSRYYDHSTNEFFNSFMNPRRPADWRDLEAEWARSVLDVPHRFVVSGVWDLPWLRNRADLAGRILGDWTVSAVYVRQSGQPWTALSQANSLGNGDVQVQRTIVNPNATGDGGTRSTPVLNSQGQVVGYLASDPDARYVQAGVGSFPTAERNSLRAPGINNVDLTLLKNFEISGRRRVQFQAQFFNLLNHPQYTGANLLAVDPGLGLNYAFVGSPGFNNVEAAGGTGGARIVQLAVRVLF